LNNHISNLQLMTYREHTLLHWKQKREGQWAQPTIINKKG
jgi:hypothetical protein